MGTCGDADELNWNCGALMFSTFPDAEFAVPLPFAVCPHTNVGIASNNKAKNAFTFLPLAVEHRRHRRRHGREVTARRRRRQWRVRVRVPLEEHVGTRIASPRRRRERIHRRAERRIREIPVVGAELVGEIASRLRGALRAVRHERVRREPDLPEDAREAGAREGAPLEQRRAAVVAPEEEVCISRGEDRCTEVVIPLVEDIPIGLRRGYCHYKQRYEQRHQLELRVHFDFLQLS